MFAPAVKILSRSTSENRLASIPPMRELRKQAEALRALSASPASWGPYRNQVVNLQSRILDATGQGAAERLLARADPAFMSKSDTTQSILDDFTDSIAEIDSWLTGAEAFAAGPESAGIVSEIAASSFGTAVIETGLYARTAVGAEIPKSTSGRDDKDISTARSRVEATMSILKIGGLAFVAIALVAGAGYVYWKVG